MQLEKFVWTGVAVGAALCIGTAPISARPGGIMPSSPKVTMHASSPKPTTGSPRITTQGPKSPKATSPKTSGPKTTTTHGQSATHAPKTTTKSAGTQTTKTHGNPHTQPTSTTTTSAGTASTATGAAAGSVSGSTTTGGAAGSGSDSTTTGAAAGSTTSATTTTTAAAPLTKSQQQLTKNTNLQSKMVTRLGTQLPDGVSVIQAASGFKNLGQFVAAVNVSNNLGIPFADLKAKMTGMTIDGQPITTTGSATTTAATTMSLGQAIQSVKGVDETTAAQTANAATTQASAEIGASSGATTTTTTTKTAKPKKRR